MRGNLPEKLGKGFSVGNLKNICHFYEIVSLKNNGSLKKLIGRLEEECGSE